MAALFLLALAAGAAAEDAPQAWRLRAGARARGAEGDRLGELFVIYNHNLREIDERFRRDSNELLLKLQYTFRR